MKAVYSDSDSNLSIDSLEGPGEGRHYGERTTRKESFAKQTVPYYRGEILVEEIKKNHLCMFNNETTSNRNSQLHDSDHNSFKDSCSTFIPHRSMSARFDSSHRSSRRRSRTVVPNPDSLRTRHRSISYLQQYRNKVFGTTKPESTTHSTLGSDEPELDKNSTMISFTTSEQSRMNTSELDFYDELINNLKNVSLSSSTQIKELDKSTPNKSYKGNHKKMSPLVLTKVDKSKQDKKRELDKKNSLEKREIYANKVKLKNQIKIQCQKEKEKLEKFVNCNTVSPLRIDDTIFINSNNALGSVPFALNVLDTTTVTTSKPVKKKNSLQNKIKGKPRNQTKKSEEMINLQILQQRYEQEKSVVDSIRKIILKK